MANEISYQVQLSLRNGMLTDQYASGSLVANQTTAALFRNVQTISTGGFGIDQIKMGSLVTPGWACFINLDAANYIEIGSLFTTLPFSFRSSIRL